MKKTATTSSGIRQRIKQFSAVLLIFCLLLGMIPESLQEILKIQLVQNTEAATTLSNPRIVADSSMQAGQKVTWDCIWFGSYPQREVVAESRQSGSYDKQWSRDTYGHPLPADEYAIVDSGLYSALSHATGWNSNGDITYNGARYRRIKKDDATYTSTAGTAYNWSDADTYHYFKYEPIKWRVLNVNGNKAFLLADQALDDQIYHNSINDITWEKSIMRSWLNGYDASRNKAEIDFTKKNFIKSAFSSIEENAIEVTNVVNKNNFYYNTSGGNDTSDKIYLLSEEELYTDVANKYGFLSKYDVVDEARWSKSSTYAKAMGTVTGDYWYEMCKNCWWWTRSPGSALYAVQCLVTNGTAIQSGEYVIREYYGCRPALNLNLSYSDLWTYAGTVCSDGTVDDPSIAGEEEPDNLENRLQIDISDRDILVLREDGSQDYNRIEVTATITNPNAKDANNVTVKINTDLNNDTSMTVLDQNEVSLDKISAGTSKQITWKIKVPCLMSDREYQYSILAWADNAEVNELYKTTKVGGTPSLSSMEIPDRYTFSHSSVHFKDYHTKKEFLEHLRTRVSLHEYIKIAMDQNTAWEGSCFGMSVSAALFKNGYLTQSFWQDSCERTSALNFSSVKELINYYQLLLRVKDLRDQTLTKDDGNHKLAIESLENALKKSPGIVTIGINYGGVYNEDHTDWDGTEHKKGDSYAAGHAIIAQGAPIKEDRTIEGITYNYYIKTYDVNTYKDIAKRWENVEDSYIYYTSDKSQICVPRYFTSEFGYSYIDYNVGNISRIIDDYSIFDKYNLEKKDYISDEDHNKNSYLSTNNKKVSVVNSKNEKSTIFGLIVDGTLKLWPFVDEKEVDGRENTSELHVLLEDCDEAYTVQSLDNNPLDAEMQYADALIQASSSKSSKVTFGNSKQVMIDNNDGAFHLDMICDKDDGFGNEISISGENQENILVSKTDDGYVVSTTDDKLDSIEVTIVKDDQSKTNIIHTSEDKVLITTENNNDIVILEDKNNDGTFEPADNTNDSGNNDTGSGNTGSGTIGQTKPLPKPIAVSRMTVFSATSSHQIAMGKKLQLSANIYPVNASNKKVIWTSSNKAYATVSSTGLVTMTKKSTGKTVIITATAVDGSGKRAIYKITGMKGAVKSLKLSGKKTMKVKASQKLKCSVKVTKGKANKKLKWTSSNPKIATVSSTGKVKAISKGKVKITAMSTDGTNKKKSITITIK